MISVASLAVASVKGTRMRDVDAIELTPSGVAEDRRFFVVEGDSAELALSGRTPTLMAVVSHWDGARGVLTLTMPDGSVVAEEPVLLERATTHNYERRPIDGTLVGGALAEALSAHLARPVRLLMRDADVMGADDAPLTISSRASAHALAPHFDGDVPDPRRFRITVTVDGVQAWEEHGWAGREIAVGDALVRGVDPVARCVVVTHEPESGRRDLPVLKVLAGIHGKRNVVYGLWCDVLEPGRIRVGDTVSP